MIGAHVMISGSRWLHSYQCDSWTLVVAGCATTSTVWRGRQLEPSIIQAVCPDRGALA